MLKNVESRWRKGGTAVELSEVERVEEKGFSESGIRGVDRGREGGKVEWNMTCEE